jgi:hypothetical protein
VVDVGAQGDFSPVGQEKGKIKNAHGNEDEWAVKGNAESNEWKLGEGMKKGKG